MILRQMHTYTYCVGRQMKVMRGNLKGLDWHEQAGGNVKVLIEISPETSGNLWFPFSLTPIKAWRVRPHVFYSWPKEEWWNQIRLSWNIVKYFDPAHSFASGGQNIVKWQYNEHKKKIWKENQNFIVLSSLSYH